jgi:hypothetical protein
MLVAARYVRSVNPRKTLIAVPVGSVQACRRLRKEADDCVCLATPEPFAAVGEWYVDFRAAGKAVYDAFAGSLAAVRGAADYLLSGFDFSNPCHTRYSQAYQ